jgi:hypothetical protein
MRRFERGAWQSIPIIPPGCGGEFFTFEQMQDRTIEALKGYLRRRIGGYRVARKDMLAINRLYRGVRWNDRPPRSVDEVSYPKPGLIKDFGRANRAGQSMFYCCRGAFPVFFELHAKAGDRIALSEWQPSENLWMNNLGYHAEALKRLGAPVPPQRLPLVNPIPDEAPRNSRLRQRMSLAFTQDVPDDAKYRYKESIAINELLFDKAEPFPILGNGAPTTDRAAGTVYPTVQLRGLADNVAILPEFVDRYLKLLSVRYVQVEAANEAMMTYRFYTLAYSTMFQDGVIIWHNDLPSDDLRTTHVKLENGAWCFRNGRGELYDRHDTVLVTP